MVISNLLKTIGWCVLLYIMVKAGPALVGALAAIALMGMVKLFVPQE